MNKEQKTAHIQMVAEKFDKAKALIFTGYRGLKVSQMTELRTKLRNGHSTLNVVKNRLVKRILKDRGLDKLADCFKEPTALASSEADPVSPAKVLVEFAKLNDKLLIKGGFMDGAFLSAKDIETLAKMPPKEVLLARVLTSMNAPATNLAGVLAAIPRKLLYALNAIKQTKQ